MQLSPGVTCGLLPVASNVFMTFAWYGASRCSSTC